MLKKIPLSKIVANPYRKMDTYPIREDKLEALAASMGRTGFWENVIGRQKNGKVELAYGHHRWVVFERVYPGASMPINLRDISDADMLRMMADENMQEWGTNALIEQETIRAVVLAYADGDIELKKPKLGERGGKGLRNAPGFRIVKGADFKGLKNCPKPYNAESIARFLGWMSGDQVAPPCEKCSYSLRSGGRGLN